MIGDDLEGVDEELLPEEEDPRVAFWVGVGLSAFVLICEFWFSDSLLSGAAYVTGVWWGPYAIAFHRDRLVSMHDRLLGLLGA